MNNLFHSVTGWNIIREPLVFISIHTWKNNDDTDGDHVINDNDNIDDDDDDDDDMTIWVHFDKVSSSYYECFKTCHKW